MQHYIGNADWFFYIFFKLRKILIKKMGFQVHHLVVITQPRPTIGDSRLCSACHAPLHPPTCSSDNRARLHPSVAMAIRVGKLQWLRQPRCRHPPVNGKRESNNTTLFRNRQIQLLPVHWCVQTLRLKLISTLILETK